MIPNTLRDLTLTSLSLVASLAWTNAFATCTPNHSGMEKTIALPATTTIEAADLGGVLASSEYNLWTGNEYYSCTSTNDELKTAFDGGLTLVPGFPNVYKTSIKGVGIKVGIKQGIWGPYWTPYNHVATGNSQPAPTKVIIQLIRIDTGVASGKLSTNFKVTYSGPGMIYTIKSSGSTEVVNDVMFTGCTAIDTVVNVKMGQENIERLKSGQATEHPFNFDVRCNGLKSTTTAQVKVYFAGNSSTDGMLALSGAGTTGVASGMGISLVNDKGVKLPFAKARSVQIEHHRSDEEGEVYRFSGTAKYALTSGEAKPGKADATMTYVIDYN